MADAAVLPSPTTTAEGVDIFSSVPLTPLDEACAVLIDEEQPIVKRMQHLFNVRQHGGKAAATALLSALDGGRASTLFRHEAAYLLGQVGEAMAVDRLIALLEDSTEDEMVRHEAAEALGAIGDIRASEVLMRFCDDDAAAVRETCLLACRRLQKVSTETEQQQQQSLPKSPPSTPSAAASASPSIATLVSVSSSSSLSTEDSASSPTPFNTVDPEAPFEDYSDGDIPRLDALLLDEKAELHLRYRALFTLRNIATGDAAAVAARCLVCDRSSALLRHEVAFVLGQMRQLSTFPQLRECLENEEEHPMARHEAALALGSLGIAAASEVERRARTKDDDDEASSAKSSMGETTSGEEAGSAAETDDVAATLHSIISLLHGFCRHPSRVIRESAEVALQNIVDEANESDTAMAVISAVVVADDGSFEQPNH